MTATRDDRGRFVSAQEFAANELLKAAVRRAVDMLRAPGQMRATPVGSTYASASMPTITTTTKYVFEWVKPDHAAVATMLAEAGRSAELLLGGGAK